MNPSVDRFYMGLALELAARGLGRTSPNPAVGCVLVRGGRIVGRGWHEAAGTPHAEAAALADAGDEARGATAYVTLEPCAHFGRTPPCTDALIAAGVARVVAAAADPNPDVAGNGAERLREAGVEVSVGVMREEAERLNEGFRLSITAKRAFIHLKLAATLDGRIATAGGDSRWVTSEASRLKVHELRGRCGAVCIGAATAVADDPRLNVRLPGLPERRILRAVLDPKLRIPPTLWMLGPGEAPSTVVFCGNGAPASNAAAIERAGARVVRIGGEGGGLDLGEFARTLYAMGVMEILVEGGGRTARTFLDARLVDRCHFFYAPRILGGSDAVPMVGGRSPARMEEAVRVDRMEVERVGPDFYVTGVPVWEG